MFRKHHNKDMVITEQDLITNTDMNALIRGQKTLEQIKEGHRPKPRTKLTADEITAAMDYMNETGCAWTVARDFILAQVEAANKPRDINAELRAAAFGQPEK
jgi:hypothetical protein